jgi:hypothetical protein
VLTTRVSKRKVDRSARGDRERTGTRAAFGPSFCALQLATRAMWQSSRARNRTVEFDETMARKSRKLG